MLSIVRWFGVLAVVFALTATTASFAEAKGTQIRLDGSLIATAEAPLASGSAKFEERSDRVRFSAEVQDIADGAYDVAVNGSSVGTVTVVGGLGDLNLDSRLGDTVAAMASGDVVDVTSAGGAIVLTGTLQPK